MGCKKCTIFFIFYILVIFWTEIASSEEKIGTFPLNTYAIIETSDVSFNERRPVAHAKTQSPSHSPEGGAKLGGVEHYPRNISDISRATWHPSPNSTFNSSLGFRKREGTIILQITNRQHPLVPPIDIVQGDMIFRDGVYSTDDSAKYAIQGIYFWQIGVLFIVANPSDNPVVDDFVLDLAQNITLMEAIMKADANAIQKIENETKNIEKHGYSHCYFSMILRYNSVSSDFNEKWAYLYKNPNYNAGETSKPELSYKSISARSPNCELDLIVEGSSIMFEAYYTKAINYVVMIGIAAFVEIMLTIRQMEVSNTQSSATKVSMLTIGQQAIMDSYLCLIHLTTGIVVENVFNAFATAAFFKFILFAMFEMRYLFTIWKSRRPQAFAEWPSMRRELGLMYVRVYGLLMIGLSLVYFFGALLQFFVLVMYSFWIPQIWCNIKRDSNKALLQQYVIGISITRGLIPLYFYGCPKNFAHTEPDLGFALLVAGWLAFQVFILYIQDKYGARFFVPKHFLPPKYDYQRPFSVPDGETVECVICMSSVDLSQKDYMVTPCNHVFHQACLVQWLNQKMECPTCRHQLPNV